MQHARREKSLDNSFRSVTFENCFPFSSLDFVFLIDQKVMSSPRLNAEEYYVGQTPENKVLLVVRSP